MSQFRFISRSAHFIRPCCRNFNVTHSGALKQAVSVAGGGKSHSYGHSNILGIGSLRSLHVSSATFSVTTSDSDVSGSVTSLPEVSIDKVSGVSGSGDEECAPQVGDSGGTGSVTSGFTPEAPGSHVGFIFSDSPPVLAVRDFLCQIRDIPGMEWTSTIIVTTIGLRILVGLPIAVSQQRSVQRLQSLQPELKELAGTLARETSMAVNLYKWNKKKANHMFKRSFKKHWKVLVEKNNCHPMRAVALGLLQVPVWVALSGAIRNVVYCLPNPPNGEMLFRWSEIAAERTPWVDSLVATDPVVFPMIFLAASLANIQINSLRKLTVPQTKLQVVIPWILRVCVTGIAVFAMFTPSAVTMYWATSSVLALLLNMFLRINRVRRFFGLLPMAKL